MEMLKPKDGVRLKVQYRPEEFTKVKGLPGDSFYIRYRGPGVLGIQGQGRGFLRRLVLVSVSETQRDHGTMVLVARVPNHKLTVRCSSLRKLPEGL